MSVPIHEFRREQIGEVEVVRVAGEIDLSNAGELVAALEETTQIRVALELAELTYIDSAGIRAVDQGYRVLRAEGRELVVVVPPDSPADWVFRVAGLSERVVAATLDEALRDGKG